MTSRTRLPNKHRRPKSSDIGTPHYFHKKLSTSVIGTPYYFHTRLWTSNVGTPHYFHTKLSTSDIGTPNYFHTKLSTSDIAHHTTSTQNYRIIYGIDTCSNYEMRVSTEIPKAMHRTACRNQPTWQPFPPVSSPACSVDVCVCAHQYTKENDDNMSSDFTNTTFR